jgi:hypothetical protein
MKTKKLKDIIKEAFENAMDSTNVTTRVMYDTEKDEVYLEYTTDTQDTEDVLCEFPPMKWSKSYLKFISNTNDFSEENPDGKKREGYLWNAYAKKWDLILLLKEVATTAWESDSALDTGETRLDRHVQEALTQIKYLKTKGDNKNGKYK